MTAVQALVLILDAMETPRAEACRQVGMTPGRFAAVLHQARNAARKLGVRVVHTPEAKASPFEAVQVSRGLDQARRLAQEAGLI